MIYSPESPQNCRTGTARLQRRDDIRDLLTLVGSQLEMAALQFFSSNGWLSTKRIGPI
jgi:hypothetical protein